MPDNYYFVVEPIYCVSGKLYATEILTQFTDLNMRDDAGHYFREMPIKGRVGIFLEQLHAIFRRKNFFTKRGCLCSINIDFDMLLHLKNLKEFSEEILSLQFIRFEINESITLSQLAELAESMMERGNKWIKPFLWLDDFDLNTFECEKALLSSVLFDTVKVDKNVLLSSPEKKLFDHVEFIKKNNNKIIIEGVENKEKAEIAVVHGADYLQGFLFPRVSVFEIEQIPELSGHLSVFH